MKKAICTLTVLLLAAMIGFASAPESILLQSIIKDKSGLVIANEQITLVIHVKTNGLDGEVVYQEIHKPVTNEYGLVCINIGEGEANIGDFESLNWNENSFVIKTSCNTKTNGICSLVGTSQLLHVTYAKEDQANNPTVNPAKKGGMFSPGMVVLAPPDIVEDWMFEPTEIVNK